MCSKFTSINSKVVFNGINIFDSPRAALSAPKIAYHMKTKVSAEISASSGWIFLRKLAFTCHKKILQLPIFSL